MEIKEVVSKEDWKSFLKLPWHIYKGNPFWVPPLLEDEKFRLNTKKNPFYQHAQTKSFISVKDGKILGRIAGIIDENYINTHREKTGFFGFFECLSHYELANALFLAVKDWLKKQGIHYLMGPFNPSINETCGLLIEGFDKRPCFMMPYNHPYYVEFVEKFGMEKAIDLFAYETKTEQNKAMSRLSSLIERLHKRYPEVRVRSLNLKRIDEEIKIIKNIFNNAWEKNWGFTPLTDKEVESMAKRLKPLIVPDLVSIGEYKGEPFGLILFLPDYNQVFQHINGRLFPFGWLKFFWHVRKIDRIRGLLLGVKHKYQKTGLVPFLFYKSWRKILEKGHYKCVELSWALEDNFSVLRSAKVLNPTLTKVYRIYKMKIK